MRAPALSSPCSYDDVQTTLAFAEAKLYRTENARGRKGALGGWSMRWLSRRRLGIAIFAWSTLGATACGDDDEKKQQDAAPVSEAAPESDSGREDTGGLDAASSDASIDSGPGGDGGGGGDGAQPRAEASLDAGPSGSTEAGSDAARDAGTTDDGASSDATPGACPAGCDDHVDCTIDTCVVDHCLHTIDDDLCQSGFSCDLTRGCQQGAVCTMPSECADSDDCTIDESCDTQMGHCMWRPLDRDGDGYAPPACGGSDCNDANGLVGPTSAETCDGIDNDCDGSIDEQVTCGAGQTCVDGSCTCNQGLESCLNSCVDVQTDQNNCGGCGTSCGSGGVCTNAACSCPAPATECNGVCTDVQTSMTNCGACGMPCSAFGDGGQLQECMGGDCIACGGAGQPCCGLTGCGGGLSCEGAPGTPESRCACPATSTACGDDACVDLRADEDHCGNCETACETGEVCLAGAQGATCVVCGDVGDPCCEGPFGFDTCTRGNTCGPNRTCVRPLVPPASGDAGTTPDAGTTNDAGATLDAETAATSDAESPADAG